MVEFSKVSIKMKNCKTFYKLTQRATPKEIIQPLQARQNATTSLEQKSLTEIHRNIQTFAFKELQEYAVLGHEELMQCKYFF